MVNNNPRTIKAQLFQQLSLTKSCWNTVYNQASCIPFMDLEAAIQNRSPCSKLYTKLNLFTDDHILTKNKPSGEKLYGQGKTLSGDNDRRYRDASCSGAVSLPVELVYCICNTEPHNSSASTQINH